MHPRRPILTLLIALSLVGILAACGSGDNGSTSTQGGPVTHPGFAPKSQQEVQDHVLALYQKTVDAMPPGTKLDSSRFGAVSGGVVPCDDNDTSDDAPVYYDNSRDVRVPKGTDYRATVAQLGDIWRSWGWKVVERDDRPRPNRFGYAPDGYTLQAELNKPNYPPVVTAGSPCYSGTIQRDDIPMPTVIQAAPKP